MTSFGTTAERESEANEAKLRSLDDFENEKEPRAAGLVFSPMGLCVDRDGRILVADGTPRVQIFGFDSD